MLNRKQLPNFGVVKNRQLDITALKSSLDGNNLLDSDQYNDINVGKNGKYSNFTITNSYCKTSFFSEDYSLNGEKYCQLYFTDPIKEIQNLKSTDKKTDIVYRTKRLKPEHPDYDPIADELNYGERNERCIPEIHVLLDWFSSYDRVTRVRLACLKNNYSIRPHIDYDPEYIVRYHIPLITNDQCHLNTIRNGIEYQTHFPADGRIYFLNTGFKHWASNNSNVDRIHLIVDVNGQNLLNSVEEYK